MSKRVLLSAFVLLGSCGVAVAQEQSKPAKEVTPTGVIPIKGGQPVRKIVGGEPSVAGLKVGSPAPAFTVDSFVKGTAITGFEKGKIYVLDFWSTSNPTSKENIPQLTALQKKHADVTFVGVAGSEKFDRNKQDNRLKNVDEFVKAQGDAIGYSIAYDSKHVMTRSWIMASGMKTFPLAFVVGRDSKIAWIGEPKDVETALDAALAAPATDAAVPNGQPGNDQKEVPAEIKKEIKKHFDKDVPKVTPKDPK